MPTSKVWFKSKEVWVGIVYLLNMLFNALGWPSIEPTPEFYTTVISLIVALRLFWTETKLSLRVE